MDWFDWRVAVGTLIFGAVIEAIRKVTGHPYPKRERRRDDAQVAPDEWNFWRPR